MSGTKSSRVIKSFVANNSLNVCPVFLLNVGIVIFLVWTSSYDLNLLVTVIEVIVKLVVKNSFPLFLR